MKKSPSKSKALATTAPRPFSELFRQARELKNTNPPDWSLAFLRNQLGVDTDTAAAVLDALIDDPEGVNVEMGEQLSTQYQNAVGGMRAVVIFGAMMIKLREHLAPRLRTRSRGGRIDGSADKGTGMKAWLARYAPSVSEPTAYRFMTVAEAVAAEAKLPAKIAKNIGFAGFVTASADELPADLRAKQLELFEFVDGTSQRSWLDKLRQKTRERDNDGGGEKTPAPAPTPDQALSKLTAETREWAETIMTGKFTKEGLWRLLDDEEALSLAVRMEEQATAIRAWLKLPAAKRSALSLEDLIP